MEKDNMIIIKKLKNIRFILGRENEIADYYGQIKDILKGTPANKVFAEPLITRESISWSTQFDGAARKYTDLDENTQIEVKYMLRNRFEELLYYLEEFNDENLFDTFDKCLEIPSEEDIYLIGDEVAIIEWGFVSSDFNARRGIIKSMIGEIVPMKFKAVYEDGKPASDKEFTFKYSTVSKTAQSDENGEMQIRNIFLGTKVKVEFIDKKNIYVLVKDEFVCENKECNELILKDDRKFDMVFTFKQTNGAVFANKNILFIYEGNKINRKTDENGVIVLSQIPINGEIEVIHNDLLQKDTKYISNEKNNNHELEIKYEEPLPPPPKEPKPEPKPKPLKKEENQYVVSKKNSMEQAMKFIFWIILIILLLLFMATCLSNVKFENKKRSSSNTKINKPTQNSNTQNSNTLKKTADKLEEAVSDIASKSKNSASNPESKYYNPEAAKKEKELQGKSGEVRVNLKWNTRDDLDLVVRDPGGNEIKYNNKIGRYNGYEGRLDVDANVNDRAIKANPQENIYWENAATGKYQVYVVYYTKRNDGGKVDYTITTVIRGEVKENKGTLNYSPSKEKQFITEFIIK